MRFWVGLFALAGFLNIAAGWHDWPTTLSGSLNDPDGYMRLERILQGIQQGHLVNIVERDDSGAGVMVEWSRLLDAIIWVLALPFAHGLGWPNALLLAGDALSPLGTGLLAVAIALAIEPFISRPFLWLSAIVAALLPGFRIFAGPGVVHYHILLLVLIILTVGFIIRAWHGERWPGFLAGICGGFAIWTTPETMPFILMAFGALMIQWGFTAIGDIIAACAAGFVDVLIFGLTIDPPQGGYGVVEIDRLSLVYVVLGLFLLVGGLSLWLLDRKIRNPARVIAGFGLMAALLIVWIARFPQVAMGPFGLMSPQDYQRFFGMMTELQPLQGAREYLQYLLPASLALAYALWRASQESALKARLIWSYIAAAILVSLLLGAKFILFVGFAAGFAATLAPMMLSDISIRLHHKPLQAMFGRVGFIFAMLVLPMLPLLQPATTQAAVSGTLHSCAMRHINSLLAPLGAAIVIAPPDATPELLFRSQITTVGSLYQHGVPALIRLSDAWRAVPGAEVPSAVVATGASYVLFCTPAVAQRSLMVTGLPTTTLWDDLAAHQPPPWLHLVVQDPATGWQLYKITR